MIERNRYRNHYHYDGVQALFRFLVTLERLSLTPIGYTWIYISSRDMSEYVSRVHYKMGDI